VSHPDHHLPSAATGSGGELRPFLADITRQLSGLTGRGVAVRVRLDQSLTEGTEIAELMIRPDAIGTAAEALARSMPPV
jgi:hypothetical protein